MNFSRNAALWIIIVLLLFALFNFFQSNMSRSPGAEIAYSQFLDNVQEGRVTSVTIQGSDIAGMDKSVAPGDDFFAHANGTWFKTTEIPPDKPSYGAGWVVFDLTTQRTAELIEKAGSTNPPRGSVAQKIADYHASYLDAAGIEAKGLKPLQPTLDRIAALADRKSLARYLGDKPLHSRKLFHPVAPASATMSETDE